MTKILLVGATGLVGMEVARLAHAGDLTLLARRAMENSAHSVIVAPTEDWAEAIAVTRPDILISTLGTTIRQAGSQAAFRAVDHDLVVCTARAAKAAGARQMIIVSSVGASTSGNFYLKTKAEVEQGLRDLAFDRLDIIRPGLLIGDRQGPTRPSEAIGMLLAPMTDALMFGALRKLRSAKADMVARAILTLAKTGGDGVHVHEHDAIAALVD